MRQGRGDSGGRFDRQRVGHERPGGPRSAQWQVDAFGHREQGPGGAQKRRTEQRQGACTEGTGEHLAQRASQWHAQQPAESGEREQARLAGVESAEGQAGIDGVENLGFARQGRQAQQAACEQRGDTGGEAAEAGCRVAESCRQDQGTDHALPRQEQRAIGVQQAAQGVCQ
jgi:hypothetical protein